MKNRFLTAISVLLVCGSLGADENDWFRPLGPPPKAEPRRISGGEGVPPLPLPATPLRRSERKRQPRDPTLIGKVVWGESANFTYESGEACEITDWNLCPDDVRQLLKKTRGLLGLSYNTEPVALDAFDGDPAEIPVLLFSGGRSVKLSGSQVEKLRAYVLAGGMLIFDSIAGSPYFYDSAKALLASAFPEFSLRGIPPDHPVYHMVYDVTNARYPTKWELDVPVLEGIYVGSRIGALISPYGLGCGWDDHEVPNIEKAVYYDVDSACKIGLNLVAYAVGYAGAGREEAKPELFGVLDERDPTDEFVFAQIQHEGAWNVHPGAASALLQRLRQNTAVKANLRRVPVLPGRDDLSAFPFLFLTGLDDFSFDAAGAAALRDFLNADGTLFINNGLGLSSFDAVVRRELKQVLPEAELKPVPYDHPLFRSMFTIEDVRYTPALFAEKKGMIDPRLEGIFVNGELRVLYSPYDIEAGWLGCEYPLIRGLEPGSAMEMGVNIVMYSVTH